ncbi:MAG TPA: Ldh family oxidoreductase [Thermomicrobiales bacterium]|jgi:LDH2 family malate/lactate/ureidoglycolate dehydrogenase
MHRQGLIGPAAAAEAAVDQPPVPRFPLDRLTAFVESVFVGVGHTPDDAATAAESLVVADLYGIESHGVARLPYQVRRITRGLVNLSADLTVVRESPSTLVLDANNGSGQALAPRAMARCIEKAELSGLCLTTVRRSNHFGVAGYYVVMATKRGLGGMAMTNSSPLVVPTFGRYPRLGTNPIALGVPTGDGPPLVLDMATSTVAYGKLEVARRAAASIPLGWAVDDRGLPTTDPHAAQFLTPLGGDRATSGHKGYGLAVFVDVFCGPLAGGAWSRLVSGARGADKPSGIGHTFMAWRIDAFRDPDEFSADLKEMIADLRATPPVPGQEATGVLVPGDPEHAAESRHRRYGIPVRREVLEELRVLCGSLELPFTLDSDGDA